MTRARDTQRSKVYDWGTTLPVVPITEDGTLRLVDAVRRAYGLTPISVRWGGLRSYLGKARYSSIQLQRPTTRRVVLHEMAHVIIAQKFIGPTPAAHGPEWVRVFLDLLDRYMGVAATRRVEFHIRTAQKNAVPQPVRAVRERALKPKRKKCPKHRWEYGSPIESKLTSKGMLVLHKARCRTCNKAVPEERPRIIAA